MIRFSSIELEKTEVVAFVCASCVEAEILKGLISRRLRLSGCSSSSILLSYKQQKTACLNISLNTLHDASSCGHQNHTWRQSNLWHFIDKLASQLPQPINQTWSLHWGELQTAPWCSASAFEFADIPNKLVNNFEKLWEIALVLRTFNASVQWRPLDAPWIHLKSIHAPTW